MSNGQFIESQCVRQIVNSINNYNDLYFKNNFNSDDVINDHDFQSKINNNTIRAVKLNDDSASFEYQCSDGFFNPSDSQTVSTFGINENQYREIIIIV